MQPHAVDGGRAVVLCRACRQEAPRDPLIFREVFMRFGSTKELISHYDARDEQEALRKLCVERKLDYRSVIRGIESHGTPAGTGNGFQDFSRPFGYEIRDGGLAVKPVEARTVGLIFEMYLEGLGLAKICGVLNRKEIPTKTGKKWQSQTVANILRNPLYAGFVREKDGFHSGKHRAIVDKEAFSDVQVAMEQRIRRPDQKPESKLFRGESKGSGGEKR